TGLLVELRRIEWGIRRDVCGDLRSFRDGNVLAMHEKKKWGCGEKQNAGGYDGPGHRPGVAPAAAAFYRAQRHFLSINKLNVVNVNVQLTGTAHPPLWLCFRNSTNCHCSMLNYYCVANLNILQHLEVYFLVSL